MRQALYCSCPKRKQCPLRPQKSSLRMWVILFAFWEYVRDGVAVVGRPVMSDTFVYRNFPKLHGYTFKENDIRVSHTHLWVPNIKILLATYLEQIVLLRLGGHGGCLLGFASEINPRECVKPSPDRKGWGRLKFMSHKRPHRISKWRVRQNSEDGNGM